MVPPMEVITCVGLCCAAPALVLDLPHETLEDLFSDYDIVVGPVDILLTETGPTPLLLLANPLHLPGPLLPRFRYTLSPLVHHILCQWVALLLPHIPEKMAYSQLTDSAWSLDPIVLTVSHLSSTPESLPVVLLTGLLSQLIPKHFIFPPVHWTLGVPLRLYLSGSPYSCRIGQTLPQQSSCHYPR